VVKEKLKLGYKETEIGIIPEDWNIRNILENSILKARIGWQGLTTEEYLRSGNFYLVCGTDFDNGRINWDNCFFINKERYMKDTNIQLDKGDVLITKDGTIGKIAYIDKLLLPATLNSGVFVVRPKNKNYDSKYLFYLISSNYFTKFLNKLKAGSTISHLYQKDFSSFDLLLPPTIEEQSAIAKVLTDNDKLIELLDLLIEKKKNIKIGIMQKLLAGKTESTNSTKKGVKKTLKQIIQIPVSDGPHLTPNFISKGIPFLSVNNIVNNKINLSNLRYISEEDHKVFSKKCKPNKGDILMGKAATVGTIAINELDFEINIWSPLALIRIKKQFNTRFIYYCFQSSFVQKQILFYTNSSSQGNIGMGDIEKLEFKIPPREKQDFITDILSDIDEEIEKIEEKREKLKLIKIGLMQQLLTGRIRLK